MAISYDYAYNPMLSMRYERTHKAKTHQRIVKNAARQFRAEGISGAGVASVMSASGLTVGGFYKHFHKKDDLVVEAFEESLREIRERLLTAARRAPAGEAWSAFVRTYLSLEHCDHAESGCPVAALASEVARLRSPLRKRILEATRKHRDLILPFVPGREAAEKERNFSVAMTAMAGAVSIARMLPEAAARQRVLDAVQEFVLARIG